MEPIELHILGGHLSKFLLEIYNGDDTFHAGQTVDGNLKIEMQNELPSCSLDISINGKISLILTPTIRKRIHFSRFAPPVEDESTLNSLAPGVHNFEFRILLPKKLVSSVTSSWIQIKYKVKARLVDSTTQKVLATACKVITLYDHLNLNLDRINMLQSTAYLDTEQLPGLCCFNWLVNPVPTVECFIPSRGFTPYSFIPISIRITKHSTTIRKINVISVQLVMVLTWQRFSKSFIIAEDKDIEPKLSEGEVDTVLDKGLGVPLLPPSGRYDAYQISVHYKVRVVIELTNKRRPLILTMPITIGTVPLVLVQSSGIDVPN